MTVGRGNDRKEKAGDEAAPVDESPPFWEWVVAGIGALALVACVGYLAWDAMGLPPTPAAPHAQVDKVQRVQDRFAVNVTVHNRGRRTVSELKVVAELRGPGGVAERADTVLDFLAGNSSREVVFYFERDPTGMEVRAFAESGQQP